MEVWVEVEGCAPCPVSVGDEESLGALCGRIGEEAGVGVDGVSLMWNGVDLLGEELEAPVSSVGIACSDVVAVVAAPEKLAASKLRARGFHLTEEELIDASKDDHETMCQLLATRRIPHAGLFVFLALRNNAETMRAVFAHNDVSIDVDALTDEGVSPLIAAVRSGSRRVLQVLLENGADANLAAKFQSSSNTTFPPLTAAISFGYPGMARDLLEHGADPNAAVRSASPLHLALSGYAHGAISEATIIEDLIRHGARPDSSVPHGSDVPLIVAIELNLPRVVEALLEKGADAETARKAKGGATAAQLSATVSQKMRELVTSRAQNSYVRCGLQSGGLSMAKPSRSHYVMTI